MGDEENRALQLISGLFFSLRRLQIVNWSHTVQFFWQLVSQR